MASNYSYMNNNAGGTNYTQAQKQQQQGMNALSSARNSSAVMTDTAPGLGATLTQGGGGGGVTAPPRQYATAPTYGPSNAGYAGMNPLFQYPQMGAKTDPKTGTTAGTYSPTAQELFPMTPMAGFSNSEDWFRNRENQNMLATQMSMLPMYQTGIQAGTNVRDFNEDVRRFNLNTDWTQRMDALNYGLSNQDRQINWAGLNEGARQFNEMLPLQWAQQGTDQYGADTQRMVGLGGLQNDQFSNQTQRMAVDYDNLNTRFANQTDRYGVLGRLANDTFANQTQRMVGMGNVSNDARQIANSYAIDQEKNRIANLAAMGAISNDQAQQEFQRLELAQQGMLEGRGLDIRTQDVLGGQQIQRQQMSLQDVINQRQMALEYARLAQQQAAANSAAYGRAATPNVSRTRRNF